MLEIINQKLQSRSSCCQPRMALVGSLPSVLPAVGAFSKFVLAGYEASEQLWRCSQAAEFSWRPAGVKSAAQTWHDCLAGAWLYSELRLSKTQLCTSALGHLEPFSEMRRIYSSFIVPSNWGLGINPPKQELTPQAWCPHCPAHWAPSWCLTLTNCITSLFPYMLHFQEENIQVYLTNK